MIALQRSLVCQCSQRLLIFRPSRTFFTIDEVVSPREEKLSLGIKTNALAAQRLRELASREGMFGRVEEDM